jgi:hypothetical protein
MTVRLGGADQPSAHHRNDRNCRSDRDPPWDLGPVVRGQPKAELEDNETKD